MLVQRAEEFARLVHKNQFYGELPYTDHLKEVYLTLLDFAVKDEIILAASWLHHSIEDTYTTYETLEIQFGKEVADLVQLVTNEKGTNRKEILEKTAPKIKSNEKALILKLADRIVNTECSLFYNEKLYKMYEKEFPRFKTLLFREDEKNDAILKLWNYLSNLCEKKSLNIMIQLNTEKWWDEEKDKELIDSYSLLSLLITPTSHLNEQGYLKLEELLKNSSKGTKFKITIERNEPEDDPWVRLAGKYENDPQYDEVLAHIEEYRKELDEREAEYYDDCYEIIEEKVYDL